MKKEILSSIQNLNVNKDSTTWDSRTLQCAPHKPLLLLSIIDGIEIGWINQPQIKLTQDLIETFFRYWNNVMGENKNTTIALPYFHMKSEPFWKLHYHKGMTPYTNSPSLGGLIKRVAYAKIDEYLFSLMKNEKKKIIRVILNTYFEEDLHKELLDLHHFNIGAYSYAQQLELLAAEPFEKYHTDIKGSEYYTSQKVQKRKYGFGLKIRDNYDHQCAICRARVKTPNGRSLVEAAHIIPWSESKNDDPRNGLALCKTHHWMFDNHLLSIHPNYSIKVSTWLKNEGEQIQNTLDWDREEIHKPKEKRFLPSQMALEEHYQKFTSSR